MHASAVSMALTIFSLFGDKPQLFSLLNTASYNERKAGIEGLASWFSSGTIIHASWCDGSYCAFQVSHPRNVSPQNKILAPLSLSTSLIQDFISNTITTLPPVTNINTIKALYEYYGSDIFPKLEDFKKRYSKATDEKHTCMIYIADDQMQTSDKNLLSFKAPEFRPIKLKF